MKIDPIRFCRRLFVALAFGVIWHGLVRCGAQTDAGQTDAAVAAPDQTQVDESTIDGEHAARKADAENRFKKRITPFIKKYCLDCHSNRRPTEAGVNFSPALKAPAHAAFSDQWRRALARVKTHDMPPEYADEQPKDDDRQIFVDWVAEIKYLSSKDPGPFVIRRLTKTEYGNTLHDLLGVDPSVADSLPDEVSGAGYLNSLSPLQLEQYLAISEKVLDEVFADDSPTAFLKKTLTDEPPASPTQARTAARNVASRVAKKAYRRPPSEPELNVLVDVFDLGTENGLAFADALRLMLKSILVSPQFLFITPASEVQPDVEIVRLDDYQLASRLSYLLWATMPDEELMSLADAGKLRDPKVLNAQAKRLLDDPRSRALFDGFGAQWLGLSDFEDKVFDPSKFPQMTEAMRAAMYDEARLFFQSVVRENRSVVSFVDADYTFLNETLASIYGLGSTVSGPEMRRVPLDDDRRGGVLGMPGILASTSFPDRTSAVKRGVWVLEQILGDHVPSAPPDVPALEKQDQESTQALTLRERTERHRTDPVCANCHKLLDPIGFGLENFDAIGRWRDRDDNGEVIDATGELPGEIRFSGPRELKTMVSGRIDEVSRNVVEKLLAYALCRGLDGYDEIVVDGLMQRIADDGYRMQTLITSVVTSYPFTHRRILDERTSGE